MIWYSLQDLQKFLQNGPHEGEYKHQSQREGQSVVSYIFYVSIICYLIYLMDIKKLYHDF